MNINKVLFSALLLLLILFSLSNIRSITGDVSQSPTDLSVFVGQSAPIITIFSPITATYPNSILLNYTIRNNIGSVWYNLDNTQNISLSNISSDFLYFSAADGNHILYLYANNTLGESMKNVSFSVSSVAPPPSGGGSGGSGGGGGGGGASVTPFSFSLDKSLIQSSFIQGESKKEIFSIKNNLNKNIEVSIHSVDLENFALIDNSKITLNPLESKEVGINFFSLSQNPPGLYFGKIVLKEGTNEKAINVILDIKQRNALFDLVLQVLPNFKTISPGKKISVLVDMTNIGLSGTAVDVNLNLFIKDLEGNIYDATTETLAVKNNLSVTRQLQISHEVSEGTYIISGELQYPNATASTYDTFEVKKDAFNNFKWIYLIIIVALLVYLFLLYKKTHPKEDEGLQFSSPQ